MVLLSAIPATLLVAFILFVLLDVWKGGNKARRGIMLFALTLCFEIPGVVLLWNSGYGASDMVLVHIGLALLTLATAIFALMFMEAVATRIYSYGEYMKAPQQNLGKHRLVVSTCRTGQIVTAVALALLFACALVAGTPGVLVWVLGLLLGGAMSLTRKERASALAYQYLGK